MGLNGRTLGVAVATVVLFGVMVGGAGRVATVRAAPLGEGKVTICHAEGGELHPITVSVKSIGDVDELKKHSGHDRDVIDKFTFTTNKGQVVNFDGRNL